MKLSYSILEDKYKMEKYRQDYPGSRRSRIEELEDNLRSRREDYGTQQRIRDKPSLKYNKSDAALASGYQTRN